MNEKIKVGIVGYGNLGKGVELAIQQNPDFELVAIFTRRTPEPGSGLTSIEKIGEYKGKIDVMLMCGGSATDLPVQVPEIAAQFNTVDSFDTHAKIPEFFADVDHAAKKGGTLSLISAGWDPGLFSLNRVLMDAALPQGKTYTFWGKGVSQGIRMQSAVLKALQTANSTPFLSLKRSKVFAGVKTKISLPAKNIAVFATLLQKKVRI